MVGSMTGLRDMEKIRSLVKTGFFHIFGSSVLNKAVAFLSSVVLVRILTKAEYGVFTYAWNIYSIVVLANGCGLENGVLQMCSEKSGDEAYAQRISSYGVKYGLAFDLALAAVLLGIGMLAPLEIAGAGALLCMLCALPMVKHVYNMAVMYLRAQGRNREYSGLSLMNTAAVFGVSAVCAFFFREKGMVLGYYGAYAASAAVGFWGMHIRMWDPRVQLESSEKRALWSISLVSMCNNGLSQLLYLLDVLVLGIMDPQETLLASYRVATIIPTALAFIPSSLVVYIYPYFAQHRGDGAWCMRQYRKAVLGLGGVNAVISAGLIALAPWVIGLMFGREYLDAVPVFRVLAANYFVSGTFRTLAGCLLVTQRRLKFNLMVGLISGGVNILADFVLIGRWGSMGAALATVLVTAVSAVMSTVYLVHVFRKARNTDERGAAQ